MWYTFIHALQIEMLCKHNTMIPLFALTARARDEGGGLFKLQWGQKKPSSNHAGSLM